MAVGPPPGNPRDRGPTLTSKESRRRPPGAPKGGQIGPPRGAWHRDTGRSRPTSRPWLGSGSGSRTDKELHCRDRVPAVREPRLPSRRSPFAYPPEPRMRRPEAADSNRSASQSPKHFRCGSSVQALETVAARSNQDQRITARRLLDHANRSKSPICFLQPPVQSGFADPKLCGDLHHRDAFSPALSGKPDDLVSQLGGAPPACLTNAALGDRVSKLCAVSCHR